VVRLFSPSAIRRFVGDVGWVSGGQGVYVLSQAAILAALTRTFSVQSVGRYGLALAVVGPLQIMSNMRLRSLYAARGEGEFRFATYFSLSTATSAIVVLVAPLLGNAAGHASVPIFTAVAISKAVESASDCFYGLYQHSSRFDLIGRALMLRAVLGGVSGVTIAHFTHRLTDVVLSVAVGWALVFLTFDLRQGRRLAHGSLWPKYEAGKSLVQALRLARLAAPLGLSAGVAALSAVLPRYSAALFLDEIALAHLTVVGLPRQLSASA
jgi:O-antigen/teichoic acid export membrane protein